MNGTSGTARRTGLSAPRRNRFFHGKMMDVHHFELETDYGIGMRRLLNRLVTGSGVVCGLDVEAGDDKRERSWYKIIGTAMRHVWPHRFSMQVGALFRECIARSPPSPPSPNTSKRIYCVLGEGLAELLTSAFLLSACSMGGVWCGRGMCKCLNKP